MSRQSMQATGGSRHKAPEPAAPLPISQLGKYEIRQELGRGAFGVVYRGHDPFVQREVAIKVAAEATPDATGASVEGTLQRRQNTFFAEARAAGRLHHPYIVTLYDAGMESGHLYLVMEYVEGETLRRFCQPDGPRLRFERVADLMLKCALALDYIHKNGVLHKDIKPGNIMVTRDGTPKIMDFGIAALSETPVDASGPIEGSPMYMSPEQVSGAPLKPASDLYALGMIMYQLLTGESPFQARSAKDLFRQITMQVPERPIARRRDVPERLSDIVEKLLSKDPAERYPAGRALAEDLAPLADMQAGGKRRKAITMSHDALKHLHFFKAFRTRELGELLDASATVTYKAGDAIIKEGETDNTLYILLMGLAEVRKAGQLVALLEKGDCFGEIGFLYAVKRTASVMATTDVMVLKVNAALLEQMSEECQLRYYKIFCENLIVRLTLTTEKASQLLPKSDLALDFILP